jgi:hypothetical protein
VRILRTRGRRGTKFTTKQRLAQKQGLKEVGQSFCMISKKNCAANQGAKGGQNSSYKIVTDIKKNNSKKKHNKGTRD